MTQATFLPYSAPFLKDVIHLQPPVLLSGCLLPRKAHLSGTSKPLPPALPTHPPSSAAVTAAYKTTPARAPTAGYLQVNASKRTSVISSPRVPAPSPPFAGWTGVLLTSQPSWSFCGQPPPLWIMYHRHPLRGISIQLDPLAGPAPSTAHWVDLNGYSPPPGALKSRLSSPPNSFLLPACLLCCLPTSAQGHAPVLSGAKNGLSFMGSPPFLFMAPLLRC